MASTDENETTLKTERDEAKAVLRWYVKRLRDARNNPGLFSVGRSETAMVDYAVGFDHPCALDYPHDAYDLARCLRTRAHAPACLHARMDEILRYYEEWLEDTKGTKAVARAHRIVENILERERLLNKLQHQKV